MTPRLLKWIEIDLEAVRSNARWVLSRLRPGARLMAVVKADAYGHGDIQVSKAALEAGAHSLGVLTLEEARRLRDAGLSAPIELLAPILPEQAREAARLKLILTLDRIEQARALEASSPEGGVEARVELDGGLGRWGIAAEQLPALLRGLRRFKRLKITGLSTHIDYVPGENAVEAEEKLRAFNAAARGAAEPGAFSLDAANSSVFMDFPQWRFDLVRIGNLLYGINPSRSRDADLKNPWRFLARVIALRRVPRGHPVGYASEFIPRRDMLIAAVPVGYSDGLTMEPAQRMISLGRGLRHWGIVRGREAPFVGRCSISHTLLDVSSVPGVRIGEIVALPIRRTAANSRLPRVYV